MGNDLSGSATPLTLSSAGGILRGVLRMLSQNKLY